MIIIIIIVIIITLPFLLFSLLLLLSLLCNVLINPIAHVTLSFTLQLMYHIQCWFSISYLSIPGIVSTGRVNISHIFKFFFEF